MTWPKGKKHSAETKAKMSARRKGSKLSAEHSRAISEGKTGKPLSEAHKRAISEAAQNRPPQSEETKAKRRGRKLTEEHKRRISEGGTGRVLAPEHVELLRAANTGKVLSDETKAKLREIRTGTRHTEEARSRMTGRTGELAAGWKGGITPANKLARSTTAQKQWIKDVLAHDEYVCQRPGCGRRGGDKEAHHIKPFAAHPKLRTVLSNGITFCPSCHDVADALTKLHAPETREELLALMAKDR